MDPFPTGAEQSSLDRLRRESGVVAGERGSVSRAVAMLCNKMAIFNWWVCRPLRIESDRNRRALGTASEGRYATCDNGEGGKEVGW